MLSIHHFLMKRKKLFGGPDTRGNKVWDKRVYTQTTNVCGNLHFDGYQSITGFLEESHKLVKSIFKQISEKWGIIPPFSIKFSFFHNLSDSLQVSRVFDKTLELISSYNYFTQLIRIIFLYNRQNFLRVFHEIKGNGCP